MGEEGLSVGEIGGIFAGVVALLGTIGGGVAWLIGWRDRQRDYFYQRNLLWEERLKQREATLEAEQQSHFERIEKRLDRAEQQVEAALNAYHLLAGALRAKDPRNPALAQADELLKAAFRLDPMTPPEIKALVSKID